MGAVSHELFRDEDLQDMYCADNGRPSLPPSLMAGALLLQFYDDVSDREAVERMMYDLRWKVALDLPLDFPGLDATSFCVFRRRLRENGQERYAFDRFLQVGRAAGFIPDKVTLLTDTTAAKGAGAVQDTYTLLRKGLRQLLKALGYHLSGKRQGLAPQVRQLVETYVDRKRKAEIDWSDPQARRAQLQVLVTDVETALALATEHAEEAEVREIGWLLTKILGDDVVRDAGGSPQLGEGTAPDRIISVTDPEMRHGHKSAAHSFNGFKVSIATDLASDLILDITDLPANAGDGQQLLPTVRRVEEQAGVTVEQVLGDGSYGSGANRAACAHYPGHPIDLVAPLSQPCDPEVDKTAFQIDLAAATATCPQGHTVQGAPRHDAAGRAVLAFTFARSDCEVCPLFARCVHSKTAGRTVRTTAYESYLQEARQRQQTAEFKERYRLRSAVERLLAELVQHGLRATRYLGAPQRQLQRLWTAAAVNLKRLFKLAQSKGVDLAAVLVGRHPAQTVVATG
jgi:transposase